ncbi:hypothetical protein PMZ80_006813 [Knufia obscura]|nr:hypothetical protein PMZ80_006813 [Knufia obscura]
MKGPLLFWMDTLCIPVRAEHESLRLAQIDKMASIYRGAVSCLVLDGELMATEACFDATVNHGSTGLANPPGRASLNLETRARVACSVWMSRSWTLQEACLPPILGIQFSNDVVIMGRHTLTDGRYEERSTKANQSVVSETEPIEPSGTDGAGVTNNDVRFEADVAGNGALPEAECNCVARALESNLFTTFCASGSSFTTAWNELAGRSTSISNDVPLIVTNLLDLNSWELLKHQYEPGEMFLRIMLSLGHLPLSIFFHEGPRQAREKSPHNNWVPAAIGNDLLTPGSHLDIQPSCLLYEHGRREYGGGSDQKDHSIYLIDTLFPLVSTNTICLDKPDLKLNVSVTRADTVYLDTTALTSTLLMIETPDLLKKGDAVRGAYFYYRDEGTGKPRRRWHRLLLALHLRSRHPTKSIDLAFLCPVRLEAIVGDNERFAEINEMYTLRRLDEQIDCRIKYGKSCITLSCKDLLLTRPLEKPDNFVRLKTRRNRSAFVALLRVVCFLFCLVVWGAIIAGFMYTPVGVFGFFIGGFIAMILAAICDSVLEPYFRRLDKWRYIRTFERIASSRAKRGAV